MRDELVRLSVADNSKFEVIPLGFDLSAFSVSAPVRREMREALRAELGIPTNARVVTLIARLVPIKRVDRFLHIASGLCDPPDIRFLVVGDGELREQLRASADALALGERLVWAGFRRDMPAVCFASDIVVLTSDNEGTPVSLIEAQAAGVPVVTTNVGGAPSVVSDGVTGFLVPSSESRLGARLRALLASTALSAGTSHADRLRCAAQFGLGRLSADLDHLYGDQLARHGSFTGPSRRGPAACPRPLGRTPGRGTPEPP